MTGMATELDGALPSWNPGPARDTILGFVARVTREGGPGFVPPDERVIVHHTDGEREFGYDREQVPSGRLDAALDDAAGRGRVVVDMKQDWKTVFPPAAAA